MTLSRGRSLGTALALSLAMLATAQPLSAADPVVVEPASVDLSSLGSLLGPAGETLAGLGGSLLDGNFARSLDSMVVPGASNPCSSSGSLNKSSNGSVTVLLLGSDHRRGGGDRMDTVIVINIARNGRIAMAAIPRDTVRIPRASGGTSGSNRVNTLYDTYRRSSSTCTALNKVRKDISKTLGTYIPYYAMIRMDEFQELINHIGGIRMNIKGTLIDYHYSAYSRKIYVPKKNDYQMNGTGNCGTKPKQCRNALKYARSRYGTEGGTSNSDFRRVRRQQEIVFYTIRRVLNRGNGSNLTQLLGAAKGRIYSNLPKTLSGARALYSHAQGARFASDDGKVFGPTRWARYVGTYTFELKLSDVRQWVDNHFKP